MNPKEYQSVVASASANHDEMMKEMIPGMPGRSEAHDIASEPHIHSTAKTVQHITPLDHSNGGKGV